MIALEARTLLNLRGLVHRRRAERSVTSLPGGVVTRPRGRGLETAELRAFAPGDDPRHLDRNATARTGHPQVRLFHAERDRTTILIADFRPSMLWGTRRTLRSIAAAEALAVAGWEAIVSGGRVGLIAVTAAETILLDPRARDLAMVRVIGGMVRAHQQAIAHSSADDPPLSDVLGLANRAAPRGAEVVLASALEDLGAGFPDAALPLSARTHLRVLRVADAFETTPPPGRYRFATKANPEGTAGRPGGGIDPVQALAGLGINTLHYDASVPPDAMVRYA